MRATVATQRFDVVRVDTTWESSLGPVFGGDPASAKRARQALEEAQLSASSESPAVGDTHVVDYERKPKFRLPLLAGKAPAAVPTYACPNFGDPLVAVGGALFSPESLRAYPTLGGIPCLRQSDAVIASAFARFAR